MSLKHRIARVRKKIGTELALRLVPASFSILSDDCWGGQVYRQLHIPYLTPTIGLWVHPKDYIQYLEAFETIHRETLIFIQTERTYPVATLAGVELHFMHYASEQEAIEKYWKRFQRIDHQRILTKIDFGKPSYKLADIERWNELKIPNSVAFYPSNREIPPEGVHQGVPVPDWVIGGVEMFDITRKHFDLHKWLRTGMVESTTFHRLLNRLVFEPPR